MKLTLSILKSCATSPKSDVAMRTASSCRANESSWIIGTVWIQIYW